MVLWASTECLWGSRRGFREGFRGVPGGFRGGFRGVSGGFQGFPGVSGHFRQRDDRKNIWEFPQKRKLCRGFPPQLLATNIILKGHFEVPGFGPRGSLRWVGWREATLLEFYQARALQNISECSDIGPAPCKPPSQTEVENAPV